MKQGVSQRAAAKAVGVTPERLRRFLKENTEARREGRRWLIPDRRPVTLNMALRGRQQPVTVTVDATSDIASHWNAVNRFLATNDVRHLAPFEGMGVKDLGGKFHPYETRPNVLRRLDAVGELHFLDIYADVAK